MSASLVLGAMIMCGNFPASAAKPERFRSDGWTLSIRHDRFAERTQCRVASTNGRILYQLGAIGFQVGHRRDTLGSWYRIDGGKPIRWQDRTAQLVAAGVEMDGPALDNPTGGWVWIPFDEARNATSVAIRPSEKAHIRRFSVHGLGEMLEAADRLGCSSDVAYKS